MKTMFKFIVSVAALSAVFGNVFADDDAPLIVMDKGYYDATAIGFYGACNTLAASVNNSYANFNVFLATVTSNLNNYDASLSSVQTNIRNAQYAIDWESEDASAQDALLDNAYQQITDIRSAMDNLNWNVSSYQNQLNSDKNNLLGQIATVSNSFPVAISDTNLTLNVYVIVTNTFEFATNELEKTENVYTNFLNYYRGIEDSTLDQYRDTVTNLLDTSQLQYYIDSSFWNSSKPRSDYLYMNYDFHQGYSLPAINMFPASTSFVLNWSGRYWTLPDTTSYNQFLNFSVMGIHDSLEYLAKNDMMLHNLLWQASTNRVISYSLGSSSTNDMVRFLTAPDSYPEQVAKIATSRNYFQRLEHWLSSIAKNTSQDKAVIKDELRDQRNQVVDGITNNVYHSVSSAFDPVLDTGDVVTNSFTVARKKFMDNVSSVFNNFLIQSGGTRSGNSQNAAQRFPRVYFMESSWAGELLKSKTHKDNDIPNYVVLQDIQSGPSTNSAWSLSLRLADIVHNAFGVIWALIGFGLCIWECIMLAKFFIVMWWRLLKFVPGISRYALGS